MSPLEKLVSLVTVLAVAAGTILAFWTSVPLGMLMLFADVVCLGMFLAISEEEGEVNQI